jgi:hypothetical protein
MFIQGLAQAADVHVDRATIDIRVMGPYRIEQPLTRKDAARMFQEMAKQPEFCGTELHAPSATADAMRLDVHLDVAISELLAREGRPNAPQHCAHARDKLARAERLGHIIVGTRIETADPIAFLAARS